MNIKKAIKTAIMGLSLGFVVMGSAHAQTREQAVADFDAAVNAYVAELGELNYQPETIDCEIAGKLASAGAWWTMTEAYDLSDASIALQAEFAVHSNDKVMSDIINNFNSPREKGAQELADTYKGFFFTGVGAVISDYRKAPVEFENMGVKEKRGRAKITGIQVKGFCERVKAEKDEQKFKYMIGGYRVAAGEF